MNLKTDEEIKNTIKFIKLCLRDEGYSKELIAYLLSTYDLNTFIGESSYNKLEIANGFLGHARKGEEATHNY